MGSPVAEGVSSGVVDGVGSEEGVSSVTLEGVEPEEGVSVEEETGGVVSVVD